jgi:hypothetical protein
MKHEDFGEYQSTEWNREYPHYASVHVYFKSKSDREKFLKKVKEILNDKN